MAFRDNFMNKKYFLGTIIKLNNSVWNISQGGKKCSHM